MSRALAGPGGILEGKHCYKTAGEGSRARGHIQDQVGRQEHSMGFEMSAIISIFF